jgi:CxxC motif-containing protein
LIVTEQQIICIGCPLGCTVTLKIDEKGNIETLTGNQCKEGRMYVVAEFQSPVRIFTATVLTEKGMRLLPVRTDKPVHRGQLRELMRVTAKLRVVPPIEAGQILVHNVLGTGANLITSGSI